MTISRLKRNTILHHAGCAVLGVLFCWSALSEIADPTEFYGTILGYAIPAPEVLLRLVAMGLPWVGLFCGLLLLANIWRESMLILLLGQLLLFLAVIGQAWARGLDIQCGCFDLSLLGIPQHEALLRALESPPAAFLRDLLLGALAGMLLRHERLHPGVE